MQSGEKTKTMLYKWLNEQQTTVPNRKPSQLLELNNFLQEIPKVC